MKEFELKAEMSEQDRKHMLMELAAKLGLVDYKLDNYEEEFTTMELTFFEGSPEGLTVYIENNVMLQQYGSKKTFVDDGILPEGWHWVINAWPYPDMEQAELDKMKEWTGKFLEMLPKAILVFQDDGSVDYNVNSINPESTRNYTVKANGKDDWMKQFIADEED